MRLVEKARPLLQRSLGEWLFELGLLVAALYAAWPIFAAQHPPIQDLPQHLAAVRVLIDYGNPELGLSQYFVVDLLRTQYLTYYAFAALLSLPFGVLLGNKLLIAAIIVATPYSLRFLLRQMRSDERLCVFALPLTWNAHLLLGFMNFTFAIALAFVGLAFALRLRREFSNKRAIALGMTTFICFYTHVVPFAFLGLGAAMVLFDAKDFRATVRRWIALVPAALAALVWTQSSPAGQSTVDAAAGGSERAQPVFMDAASAIADVPNWLTDILHDPADSVALAAYLVLLFFALTFRSRNAEQAPYGKWLAILAPLAAALYFITPASYDWIWPINARFPLLALLFTPLAIPKDRGPMRATVIAVAIALSVVSTAPVARAFTEFENEVGRLDDAIGAIPKGARVAALIFDRGSRQVKFSPFIHSAAWVQAENGGAVMFTFADFPQSPFFFRDDNRPPRVVPRWEWMPERVVPSRDLSWYDYVLVRGGPGRIAQERGRFALVFESEHWRVYRHNR